MKKNGLLKALTLTFALLIVILVVRFVNGPEFQESLNTFFGPPVKTFAWCPDHTTDFKWNDTVLATKFSGQSPNNLKKMLCSPAVEPIENIEIDQVEFTPLVSALSAEAKVVELEWNPKNRIFRSQGMPFKSSTLARDLLDESP